MKNKILITLTALIVSLGLSKKAHASVDVETVAKICVATGTCAPIDPEYAMYFLALSVAVDEFNKRGDGFGENGELRKLADHLVQAVNLVFGPGSDIGRAVQNVFNDVTHGPSESNDIIKALSQIKISC